MVGPMYIFQPGTNQFSVLWTRVLPPVLTRPRKLRVEQASDFSNGLVLMNLLEILFKKAIARFVQLEEAGNHFGAASSML